MPLPDNISKVTVTGKYLDIFGMPIVGKVQFTIKPVLIDGGAKVVIVPRVVEAVLKSDGSFSVELPATDDPDLNPTNFTITVTEQFEGGGGRPPFQISLPEAATEPIDITQFATTQPPGEGEVTYATTSALYAEATNRANGDAAILAQKGAASGIAPLGADSKVDTLYLPDLSGSYLTAAQRGAADGVASLDSGSKVPSAQIPDLSGTYIPVTQVGAAGGVATLDGTSKLTAAQVPDLSATYQTRAQQGVASGYPSLDSSALIPSAQIPQVPDKVPFFTVYDRLSAKAASFDDPAAMASNHILATGTIYLIRVPVRVAFTMTSIELFVTGAPSGMSNAQVQLYNGTTHAAISSSNAAATSALGTIGYASITTLGVALTPGEYWVAVFAVWTTTGPGLGGIAATQATALPGNMGRTTATQYRFATHSTTGISSFPASVTPVTTNARQIFAQLR
ncbi:hypothetical protein AB0F25_30560 [Streptomyces wedmorensis]|uniref:hypothetical protein n=1 Tax=Streptomyces wedmorensis TaxID=43759 RepID=UPI003421D59A